MDANLIKSSEITRIWTQLFKIQGKYPYILKIYYP